MLKKKREWLCECSCGKDWWYLMTDLRLISTDSVKYNYKRCEVCGYHKICFLDKSDRKEYLKALRAKKNDKSI